MTENEISGVEICNEDYSGKIINETGFFKCEFKSCSFEETVFRNADFSQCRFTNCIISNPLVDRSAFEGIAFENSKIVGMDFCNCRQLSFDLRFGRCGIIRGARLQ